jgi:hypothetical protein
VSCPGQPTKTATLGAGQLATITTAWGAACSPVTLASANGWDTNYDNLVLDGGASAPTATPTPIPAATATPTRTPLPATPTPATVTTTFDDRAGQNQALNGQYPAGVIDWGSNQWFHAAPWGQFTTKSVSFNAAARTSASFTFLTPRKLVSLRAYNGGGSPSTVTLSCAGQATKTVTVPAGQLVTIQTGWAGTCGTVTVGSSNGWDTNLDDLVHAP